MTENKNVAPGYITGLGTEPKRKITPTGILRGAVQPVRFGELAAPVLTTMGTQEFKPGDHVALQYWGGGVIRVTKVDSHLSFPALAHSIQVYEPEHIQLDYTGESGNFEH